MRIILFVFLLIFTYSFSQEIDLNEIDTLKYNYRSGSNKIDSLDYYHTSSTTLNAGGSFYHPFGSKQQSYSYFLNLLDNSFIPFKKLNVKYTVLPHLGFIYSTGSSGIQFMHTDFQQLINKNTLLNFNFEVNSLGKLLRNGDFRNTYIDLLILHKSRRIINNFLFRYYQSKMSLNSGIQDTSLINTQLYSLQQVVTENSSSIQKKAYLKNQLAINLLKDSINFFGILYETEWQIRHRVFIESGDISTFYSKIYIDSFNTRDQYQVADISNGIGLKYLNKNFSTDVVVKHNYWDMQNLAIHHDTNEIYLDINVNYKFNKIKYFSLIDLNFIGAKGQIKSLQNLNWKNNFLSFRLNYLFQQFYPIAEQRFYFSNNYSWNNNIQLQRINQLSFSSIYEKNKFFMLLNISYNKWNNKYFLKGDNFYNDTLNNISFINFSLKSSLNLLFFGIQPYIALNLYPNNFSYVPIFDSRLRVFFNKKMFKSKKLDFLLGVDLSYITSHQLLSYNRSLGIYTLNNKNSVSNEYIGLDFFTGIQLNVFRFYLKIEKIDYLWSKRNQWELSKVPISPMLFRLGLTWDFFN